MSYYLQAGIHWVFRYSFGEDRAVILVQNVLTWPSFSPQKVTTGYSIDDDRLITMGVLTRPQHEAFAQLVANGSTIVDAYEKAGYPRNRSNACRLRLRERISARIDELVAQKSAAASLAQLTAAEKAGVDQYWVMRTLRRNCVMAMRHGDRAAANRAAELIGKHLGMFIDRKELQIDFVDDSDEYLQRIMELVNSKTIDAEPLAQPAANDGQKYGLDDHAPDDSIDIIEERS